MITRNQPNPMKLAIVIERFDPGSGGAERSTAQIATQLAARGHDITILCAYSPQNLEYPDVTIERMARYHHIGAIKLWQFSKWARNKLAQGDYDSSLSVTTAVPAAILQPRAGVMREIQARDIARRRNPISRLTRQLFLYMPDRRQLRRRLEKVTINDSSVKHYIAISSYMARQLKEHYKIDDDMISVIPNAAEVSTLTDDQKVQHRRMIRDGFAIDRNSTVFLFAANDPWRKGAEPLFEAVKLLNEKNDHFNVMVVGCQDYKLHRLAARMGIDHLIRFVGSTREIDKVYCASDVTVLPSYYDPASKVVIESLMLGIPAISSSCNGSSEFIAGDNGLSRGRVVADPDDVKSLCQAMTELTDPEAREHCTRACQGLSDQLNMTRHVDQLEKVFDSMRS